MKILVKALRDDTEFRLDLALLAGAAGLSRGIEHVRIQKPGLAIAGLSENIQSDRVQVLGNTEMSYLRGLAPKTQRDAVDTLLRAGIACIVVTAGLEPMDALLELAEQREVCVFGTTLSSGTFINRAHLFLDEHLSPEIAIHGVLLDVFGVGLLLTGQSGIGKSESALDLILRGHRLVADDAVVVRRHDRDLVGSGSPVTRHHMELRGLGIINVAHLFGAASVCDRKHIELLVEMVEWQDGIAFDRTGLDEAWEDFLGLAVPKVRLPIRPGRNVAAILEVAARNHLLKLQGHNSARAFEESLKRRLSAATGRPGGGLGES